MPSTPRAALPPGPRVPGLVQNLAWLLRPYEYLSACARRFGDPFTLRFAGFGEFVVFSDPRAIRDIFAAPPEVLEASEGSEIFRPFVGDASVLLLEGERHQRARRLLHPPLHAPRIRAHAALVHAAVLRVTENLSRGARFSVLALCREISLEVLLGAILGLEDAAKRARARRLLEELLTSPLVNLAFFKPLQIDLGPASPWGRLRALAGELDALLRAELARRRHGAEACADALSVLASARDEEGRPLDDAEVRDQIATLLLAGHDTTSTTLAWTLHAVHGAEPLTERAVAEADALHAPAGGEARDDDAGALRFIEACCKEALRMWPVVPLLARGVRAPIDIQGHRLPLGVKASPCVYLAHRREEIWPEPDRFRPERFLERSYAASEFLPFGGGARRCAGAAFALLELRVALTTLLRRFRFARASDRPEKPVRRAGTIVPAGGCPMIVTEVRQRA